jgi:hypothetical protein
MFDLMVKKLFPSNVENISQYIKEKIDIFFNEMINEIRIKMKNFYIENRDSFTDVNKFGMYLKSEKILELDMLLIPLGSLLMDKFTMYYIFQNDKNIKNIILYEGEMHVTNIRNFLNTLGFKRRLYRQDDKNQCLTIYDLTYEH